MIQGLLLLHLVGLSLGLGGLLCHLLLLGRFRRSSDAAERTGSERMALALVAAVQAPGVYLSILTGIGLAWASGWEALQNGWIHFKLLFVFWILLATRLMGKNARNIRSLREQCGDADSDRLSSLKDNHSVIGYVTAGAFLVVLVFSLWKPL